MAYDEKIADRVRRALAGRRGLAEKKMMGGICFMLAGNMCCGVSGSALLVRVGREAYPSMLTRPHVRPLEFAGRRASGFVLVDPGGTRTERALAAWIERGVEFAATLPAKKSVARKPKRTVARKRR